VYKTIGSIWTSEREGDIALQARQRCVSQFILFSWIIGINSFITRHRKGIQGIEGI
jgi:hypothetical protein